MNTNLKSTSVSHLLHGHQKFSPPESLAANAHIGSFAKYQEMYQRSINDADSFWLEYANTLDWFKKPTVAGEYLWDTEARIIEHSWFKDGQLNISVNCLDRHLTEQRQCKPAIIWQGDANQEQIKLSYQELYEAVCRFANVLKSNGIKKGDRVCIYMPMIPELAIAMLGCARIGAIHSIVFGGFSAESLSHRINDSGCKLLVTANSSIRGGKQIPLKAIADQALIQSPSIEKVIVVRRNDLSCEMQQGRDVWYHEEILNASEECSAEVMNAEDPFFILYTSGSTGKPKGVLHTQAGYLLHASLSHQYIFDIHENDVYWCTADFGWITGHSYGLYGPLANGSTTLMFEGIPTYPNPGRFWEIVEKYRVTTFYTAPTVIRHLISMGETFPKKYDLSSLRILGSVGEPINPEAWIWYYTNIGHEKCPIVDTWWQTETGGIMITPLPGSHTIKPGSASRPFFGVEPIVLRDDGSECSINEGGSLCIRKPWPGIMRTTWGDHERFIDIYFTSFKNAYFSGDGCLIDDDGDFWLLGRIDDVVNISGHRLGTAEVESTLESHESVAEAAVVPIAHEIKGQGLYAYVTLVEGVEGSEDLKKSLNRHVREEIGAIAIPEKIHFTKMLPKTRSGKIMRRILRKIAAKELDLGDISTLADPQALDDLFDS